MRALALEKRGRNRLVGAFVVPHHADDPPPASIVEQLNAVDAPNWTRVRGIPMRFVRAKRLHDIPEGFARASDLALAEPVPRRPTRRLPDIVIHRLDADHPCATVRWPNRWHESSARHEERTESIGRRSGADRIDILSIIPMVRIMIRMSLGVAMTNAGTTGLTYTRMGSATLPGRVQRCSGHKKTLGGLSLPRVFQFRALSVTESAAWLCAARRLTSRLTKSTSSRQSWSRPTCCFAACRFHRRRWADACSRCP
jgi:hypothetical protein